MLRHLMVAGGLSAAVALLPVQAAEKPVAKVQKAEAVKAKKEVREAWRPETLSGQIVMVDAAKHLIVVKGPTGVPFDMDVRPSTRIRSGDQTLTLKDLAADRQKNVSVRYVPERAGDIARSIKLTS